MVTKRSGATYEQFMREVDRILLKRVGLTTDELPDWLYRDAYDENRTAVYVARETLEAAREGF